MKACERNMIFEKEGRRNDCPLILPLANGEGKSAFIRQRF
jgi:hypothetical protein